MGIKINKIYRNISPISLNVKHDEDCLTFIIIVDDNPNFSVLEFILDNFNDFKVRYQYEWEIGENKVFIYLVGNYGTIDDVHTKLVKMKMSS